MLFPFSSRATDRLQIYAPFLDLPDCPIRLPAGMSQDALFVSPFAQLTRLQLLAREMERTHEADADVVSVLLISPARNLELERVISEPLRQASSPVSEVRARIVDPADYFARASIEERWMAASRLPHGAMARL